MNQFATVSIYKWVHVSIDREIIVLREGNIQNWERDEGKAVRPLQMFRKLIGIY